MISEQRSRWFDRTTYQLMESAPLAKPIKNPDGTMRTTTTFTLKHAKQFGALPSVTYYIKETLAESGGLKDYWNNCLIRAMIEIPFKGKADDQLAYEEYKDAIIELASQHKIKAADRGKELHAAVSIWIEQQIEPQDPVAAKICEAYSSFFQKHEAEHIATEETLHRADLGIVGTPDQIIHCKNKKRKVIDLKTVEDIEKFRVPYDSWMIQEGAYSWLSESDPDTELWQAVACRKTGNVEFLMHNNPVQWRECAKHLYEVFVTIKGYDPRKFGKQ